MDTALSTSELKGHADIRSPETQTGQQHLACLIAGGSGWSVVCHCAEIAEVRPEADSPGEHHDATADVCSRGELIIGRRRRGTGGDVGELHLHAAVPTR